MLLLLPESGRVLPTPDVGRGRNSPVVGGPARQHGGFAANNEPEWTNREGPSYTLHYRNRYDGAAGGARPGVAGAGFGALANSHLRRQMGHVFLLCSHVLMHIKWK